MKFELSLLILSVAGVQQSSAASSTSAAASGHRSNIMQRKPIHRQTPSSLSYDEEMDSLIASTKSRSRSRTLSPVEVRGGDVNTLQDRLKVGFYFALWYALNVIYNSKSTALLNFEVGWTYSYKFCHFLVIVINLFG